MFTTAKGLFYVLSVAVMAACATPPIAQYAVADSPTEPSATSIAAAPTAQPQSADSSADTAVAPGEIQLEVEFDPEGLAIGPGSGFIALNDPAVVPGVQASWLAADEQVLGVVVGDEARAYPISQMAYHHIANDQIDGEPYLVTY